MSEIMILLRRNYRNKIEKNKNGEKIYEKGTFNRKRAS